MCADTCDVIVFNKVFIGVGRHLLIISKSENKLLRRITIFKTDAIYGIQFQYCNKLLVYGGNKLKIFKYNNISYNLEDENYVTIEDWILAAKWLDYGTHIAVVSMHNIVTIFTESLVKIKNYTCSEKCILYSAFICCDDVKSIIILSGTVFSEVLIWRPVPAADALCPVLYRLIGHKVIFYIQLKINNYVYVIICRVLFFLYTAVVICDLSVVHLMIDQQYFGQQRQKIWFLKCNNLRYK